MRDFKRDGQRLAINGRTVFLRGRTDSANYPLTGFPPMDKDGWLRVLGILKEWGLNHVRFHSWCPPEAAFEAAQYDALAFREEDYEVTIRSKTATLLSAACECGALTAARCCASASRR
mgnify:CR=1 FL=1